MFGYLKRTFGVVTVSEKNGIVKVEGVNANFMNNDFVSMWKTSKIGLHMFDKVTKVSFEIPSFFALDLRYMLEKLLSTGKSMRVSRRTARQIVDGLNKNTWLANTMDDDQHCLNFDHLNKFLWKPLDHQLNFMMYYDKLVPQYGLHGLILAGAAGSGKTFASIALAECLESDYVIVVSPKNAVYKVWKQTISTVFKNKPTDWYSPDNTEYAGQKYMVCHYDYLEKFIKIAKRLNGKITIILDESHNLNEISALRTLLFIELCNITESKNIIWASGTSFKAQGSESIPIFKTIDPRFTDKIAASYKKLYGSGGGRALDVLANRVDLMSFKIEKSELKLAPPILETIGVKVPNGNDYTLDTVKAEMVAFVQERTKYYAQRKAEDQRFFDHCLQIVHAKFTKPIERENHRTYLNNVKLIQENIGDLSAVKEEMIYCNRYEKNVIAPALNSDDAKRFKDVKSIIKYVSLKIQGECLGRILGKKRMECINSVAKHIDYTKIIESTEKKTVIFTSYVNALETTSHTVADLGYNPMVVYGKTNNELSAIVTAFETKPEINPLIATYQSLSTAVPLTVADTMIMVNAPFRDYVYQQAISRIHRLGADTQVRVYTAMLDTGNVPNLSSRSIDILAWSQTQVEQITRIKSPFPVAEIGTIGLESADAENVGDITGICMEELDIYVTFEDIDDVADLEPVVIEEPAKPTFDRSLFNWNIA